MRVEDLSTYEIIEKREIPDINSVTYLCRHKKTGARVALVSNDDENKVFYIGFRTTPKDSTGVAHILEHSVLCGSKEFPVKDPFVELVKGSLNTFLNAMTYPDKTVYPVASCNDKDFQNLMHVYLDAVFYPNIYKNESIFRQEGWHYELEGDEEELKVNGVVYNEMKGAFSSPDDVLEREIMNSLYPHTTYGCESGGDPEVIPELTYEEFLDFHRKFYHPSNSYIYLYGNMDMAEKLTFIDEHYLSAYDALKVDSEVTEEPAFDKPGRIVRDCPIGEGEDEEENTYLSQNFCVGDSLDPGLCAVLRSRSTLKAGAGRPWHWQGCLQHLRERYPSAIFQCRGEGHFRRKRTGIFTGNERSTREAGSGRLRREGIACRYQLLRIQIQRGRFRFLSQGTDVWFTGAGQLAV